MTEEERHANPFLAVALDLKALNSSIIETRGEIALIRSGQITEDRLRVIVSESLKEHQKDCPAVTGTEKVWAAIDKLRVVVYGASGVWLFVTTGGALVLAWLALKK